MLILRKFCKISLLNRQNGTFSIDLWNGFTENRKAIASRVWLDCYYVVGVGACWMKFLVTLTKQIEIVVEAEDLVSAKDEGEYLGNIELRDEIDRNKAVDWTLVKIEGI